MIHLRRINVLYVSIYQEGNRHEPPMSRIVLALLEEENGIHWMSRCRILRGV